MNKGGTDVAVIKKRELVEIDGMLYDVVTFDDGTVIKSIHFEHVPDPEPTQLDRIEEAVNNLAADSVTVEKLNAAIAEGVNEV